MTSIGTWQRWLLLAVAAIGCIGAGWMMKRPCAEPSRWDGRFEYASYCYNEFTPLYAVRGFDRGRRPYLDEPFEYPVLSGEIAQAVNDQSGSKTFFYRLSIINALVALLSVFALALCLGGPTPRVFAYALAPPLAIYLFQNFDQMAVLPALLGMLALKRDRMGRAGVGFGIGAGVKLFPGVLAVGAMIALLAQKRIRAATWLALSTGGTFVLLNLPFAIANPRTWWATYAFHSGRVADWGSVLFWLSRYTGWGLVPVTRVGDVLGPLIFVGLLILLGVQARRRALSIEACAVFALAAFLLTNKIWSPQYALWLLPFLMMFELPFGWWTAFCVIEVLGTMTKFEWFSGPGGVNGGAGWSFLYQLSVFARFLFTTLLAKKLLAAPRPEAPMLAETAAPTDAGAPPPCAPGPDTPPGAPPPDPSRRLYLPSWPRLGATVLLAFAVVFLARIGNPPSGYLNQLDKPEYIYDECYQAFTAHRYVMHDPHAWDPRATRDDARAFETNDMDNSTTYEWVHPPTAKLVMAAFIKAFGFNSFGYRFGSYLFGLLTLLLGWRLAARLRGERFGLLVLIILGSDGMIFLLSRLAMNDIYATACVVAAMGAFYRFWTVKEPDRRIPWLFAAGALFGVGVTMKWNAGTLGIECAALAAGRITWDWWRAPERARERLKELGAWVIAFGLVPPAIYLFSYLPYFWMGHTFADFRDLQHQMGWYHANLKATHTYGSAWYGWPFILRPVWFYAHTYGPTRSGAIYAMGNPAIWWLFIPSQLYMLVRFARTRSAADGLILCGFFGAWLPWMFIHRVGFIQYLLPAVPFGVLAVATAVDDARARWPRAGTVIAAGYVTLCVSTFLFFYPIWTGIPVPARVLASRYWLWFKSWR